jgi:hypothetical protein
MFAFSSFYIFSFFFMYTGSMVFRNGAFASLLFFFLSSYKVIHHTRITNLYLKCAYNISA